MFRLVCAILFCVALLPTVCQAGDGVGNCLLCADTPNLLLPAEAPLQLASCGAGGCGIAGGVARVATAPVRAIGRALANGHERRASRREARGGLFGGVFRGRCGRGGCR